MTSMADRVTGGVNTHLDVHVAAALDHTGALLGTASFPAGAYRKLLSWLRRFGDVELVGVEGTGSYGSGLVRYLRSADVAVVEVDRPNRQDRRRRGKSDTVDAVAAARAAPSPCGCCAWSSSRRASPRPWRSARCAASLKPLDIPRSIILARH